LLLEANRPAEALDCVDTVLPAHEEAVRTEQDRVKTAAKEQQEAEPLQPGSPGSLRLILRKMPIVPDRSLHRDWARLLACRGAALPGVGRGPKAVKGVRQPVATAAGIVYPAHPLSPPPASLASLWAFLPTLFRQQDPAPLYDLACYLALAST